MDQPLTHLLLGVLAVTAIFSAIGLGAALLAYTPLKPPASPGNSGRKGSARHCGPP